MKLKLELNGKALQCDIHPGTLLSEWLRQQGCFSVKHSCEQGDSGCDAILLNGLLVNSSITLAAQAHEKSITTVEGIGDPEHLHPIQQAFVDCGAIQCGYCSPAMILSAYALLRDNPQPSEGEVRDAFSGILCRCTGYAKPVEAVQVAAQRMREGHHAVSGGRA